MDLNALLGTLLSGDSISNISQMTGTTQKDVKNVLSSVLPDLLNGAGLQATSEDTVEGFAGALQDHAKVDTSDALSFFSNVDPEDGYKILNHLLGSNRQEATKAAAERSGLSIGKTGLILAVLAPMLMSLLGKQTQQQQAQQQAQQNQWAQMLQPQQTNILGGNTASGLTSSLGGLFSNLLGGGSTASSSGSGLSSIISSLLGGGF